LAPKYIMRVIRTPMPGKNFEVLDRVIGNVGRSDARSRSTTMGVFSASRLVITTTPFESLVEAEQAAESVLSSAERRAEYDATSALCSSVNIGLSRIIEAPEGLETANWLHRYVFQSSPTGRPALLAALREIRSHQDSPKSGITSSLHGSVVVAATAVESLSQIEERFDALANDAGVKARTMAALGHVDSWGAGIARVYRH
jgi:hypothetical protein